MRNYDALTPPVSDCVYNVALTANVARPINWPTGATRANISASFPVWAAGAGNTAQVPAGDVLDGTGSAYNKAQFSRNGDASLSIISATTQVISIEYWS